MKRLWLVALFVVGLFFTVQNARAIGVTTLELDREITLEAPDIPMDKATAPKLLYKRYNYSHEPYVKVYRFRVEPGHRYTFYMIHPADGISMNAYLRGDNPLTDYTSSYGPSGYLRNFVSWGQQPRKSSCEYQARRYNFTISPESEHPLLYLVAIYAKPDTSFKVLLKSQADSDEEVRTSTQGTYCPKRKGFTWGKVYKRDFLLTLIPGEKGKDQEETEGVALVEEDGQPPLLPLNREISLEAPDMSMDKATAPKLLCKKYYMSWEPYVKVYRFRVEPGHKYTFYMIHPADGISMNAYLRGDNPLSDYTASYRPSGYINGFVSWRQQPRNSSCEYQARRDSFTISPKSEHPWLYLVATYARPDTSFIVLLNSKADSDEEVRSSTQDAYCPQRKGFTWGQVWKKELLLTLIPGEKKVEDTTVSTSTTGGGGITPPSSQRYDDIRTVCDWVAYIRSGQPFQVTFDTTSGKFDDSVYTGDWSTDPMGTLKGGETYRLTYTNGKFECTGFNQGAGSVATFAYIADPEEGVISLWGRLFNFDGKGRVWDQDFGIVGHLSPVQ
ncbi:MAG: hypothetical protein JRD43_04265 [Deltaproteobacteria bacterium]|nr:hypothetical protein [Deltaproteobacteria bacterium]MBW2596357.1 hypothetical protein [Deltaproteobacteria bacterium]